MSTITNHAGLPEAIIKAVQNDPYDPGECDITVGRLIQPPRKVELERRHKDEIIEDASERIWAIMGQCGHTVLERSGVGIVEVRQYVELCGWRIGGKMDVIYNTKIVDFKFTSVWSAKDGAKPEWIEQLNCYSYICRRNGIPIESLEITCIYRDWSVLESKRNSDYPRQQAQLFVLPHWSENDQEQFMRNRVVMHQAARKELPDCTPLDRWEKPEKFALMKHGRQRAVRLYDNRAQAEREAEGNGALYVDHRPREQVRCDNYCSVRPFCTQADKLGVPAIERNYGNRTSNNDNHT